MVDGFEHTPKVLPGLISVATEVPHSVCFLASDRLSPIVRHTENECTQPRTRCGIGSISRPIRHLFRQQLPAPSDPVSTPIPGPPNSAL